MHAFFSRHHPVFIALDRIDLAIMGDQTIWMGSFPGRCRIGRKTGMDDPDRALIVCILQVVIKSTQLIDQEHAFVDDRSTR